MKQATQKYTLHDFTYMTFTVLAKENQGSPGRWWRGSAGKGAGKRPTVEEVLYLQHVGYVGIHTSSNHLIIHLQST